MEDQTVVMAALVETLLLKQLKIKIHYQILNIPNILEPKMGEKVAQDIVLVKKVMILLLKFQLVR